MKRILFTKHAKEMLEVRNLAQDIVERSVRNPDDIFEAKDQKRAYLKYLGTKTLKVIVAEGKNELVVITCYWIAKGRVTR